MKKYILALTVAASMSFLITSCKTEVKEKKEEKVELSQKEVYQCPMDCEKGKTYKEEGKCPVCHMNLRKSSKKKEHNHSDKEHKH
jgi:uncharacterized paraquat-inducible protein A